MPQKSAIYSAARIRVQEKYLLNKGKLEKLSEATPSEALHLLTEFGYGEKSDSASCDSLLNGELKKARALVFELTSDETVTNVFLMKQDIHNLKVLIKQKLLKDASAPPLIDGGVFTPEAISLMVRLWNFSALPKQIIDCLAEVEFKLAEKPDPQMLSVTLDKAYAAYALSVKNDFVSEYFRAWIDFYNIDAMFRLKRMGFGYDGFFYIPGGTIEIDALTSAYSAEPNALPLLLTATGASEKLMDAIKSALTEYSENLSIARFERDRDNYLIGIARERGKWDMESVAPVVSYLLAREQEVKCIRLVLTAKRNGLSKEIVAERLRELYG
ncbi:MAG: DUF2764 family protein [Clostridia bacterium]